MRLDAVYYFFMFINVFNIFGQEYLQKNAVLYSTGKT